MEPRSAVLHASSEDFEPRRTRRRAHRGTTRTYYVRLGFDTERRRIPAGPVLSVDGVFDDPQVQHLGMTEKVGHPEGEGEISVLRHPVTFSVTPTRVAGPLRRPEL